MNGVIIPLKLQPRAAVASEALPKLREVSSPSLEVVPERTRGAERSGVRETPMGTRKRVLVIDDDPGVRAELERALGRAGYDVEVASDDVTALALFSRHRPDVVVTESHSKMGEWELVRWLSRQDRALPIIVLGQADDRLTAVTAMREGARDYMLKPLDCAEVEASVQRVLGRADTTVVRAERSGPEPLAAGLLPAFGGLIGTSVPMQRVYKTAATIARSRATLLITGETGTGKSRLARAIHEASDRRTKPFVAVQSTAFVENLLESELFGHERGSFTGADHRRIGRFEQAHLGTLFLDEVGEMSPSVQVKLLRVLQERAFERVGGNETLAVDVRVIAATSRDLRAEVEAHRFREDLYYRLNVVRIEMPPLRVRADDVLLLADGVLDRCAVENGKHIEGFTPRARDKLLGHMWAGNVRELENTIERAVVMCEDSQIDAPHLELEPSPGKMPLKRFADIEREAILGTLAAVSSTARAAEVLGISVRTIHYRLKEYGLTGQRRRAG